MPLGKVEIEWKDRVYTAGVASAPDILYYSSIADPDARTVAWVSDGTDSGAGDIAIEQEDGGGGVTALEKVPGYLLIFKERTNKLTLVKERGPNNGAERCISNTARSSLASQTSYGPGGYSVVEALRLPKGGPIQTLTRPCCLTPRRPTGSNIA
jgi:hypothetical protein